MTRFNGLTATRTEGYPPPALRASLCLWKHPGDGYFLMFPNGVVGALRGHQITEHEDGTITASPSIRIQSHLAPEIHGYLERNVWRDC